MSHFRVGVAGVVCLIIFASALMASEITQTTFVPQYNPTLKAHRAQGEIKIDGELNDPGWLGAQPATNFTEHSPGQEVAPPVRTEAFVAYDENNLYLAAICYADPNTVRASMCERERIFDDDNIGFFFDTFGDASRAYIININPYGIPYDAMWSSGWGEDGNFDGKVHIIESVDQALPKLLELEPDVLIITGDHSTPAKMKSHSWHPVPFLLWAPETVIPDRQTSFGERSCQAGGLGTSPALDTMSLALAHANRINKYGA